MLRLDLWSFWIWWFAFPRSEPIMYLFLDLDWWWPVETSDSTTTCLPGCLPGGLTSYLDINSTIWNLSFAGFQISEKNATQWCDICHQVAFTDDGRSIVTGWSDGGVRFYTPESGNLAMISVDHTWVITKSCHHESYDDHYYTVRVR